MATSDPLTILITHNHWATKKIIEAALPLSAEQLDQKFDMGPGTLRDTLTHTLMAMQLWTDVLMDREIRPRIDQDGVRRTPQELLELLEVAGAELADVAKRYPLDALVKRERGGKMYEFPRGVVLTHLTTHGMHHRAQCLNMLRRLGVSPLPPSSVVEWNIAGSPAS